MRVTHNNWQGCNTHSAVCARNRLAAVALFPLCLHGSEPLAFHVLSDLDRILAQAVHTSSYVDAFEAPSIGLAACHGPYSVMNVLQGSTAFQPSSRAVQYMAACNMKYQSKNAYASLLRIVAHETGSQLCQSTNGGNGASACGYKRTSNFAKSTVVTRSARTYLSLFKCARISSTSATISRPVTEQCT